MSDQLVPLRFSESDAICAGEMWGFNCGPAAIAAVCGFTVEELRPLLSDFEAKLYTNPTLMWRILRNCRAGFSVDFVPERGGKTRWPFFGLARVQWEGPWTEPGVPIVARYRKTHWIGVDGTVTPRAIFDINAMNSGGWIAEKDWSDILVPWLLKECHPTANGKWHVTHAVHMDRAQTLQRIAEWSGVISV